MSRTNVDKEQIGLGRVADKSEADMVASGPIAAALSLKRPYVSPKQYGSPLPGNIFGMSVLAYPASALQAAIDAVGAEGGAVYIDPDIKILGNQDIVLKPNVWLEGPHNYVGSPKDNTEADYATLGGAVVLGSAYTIRLKGGASVTGLLVYKDGTVFPSPNADNFAGTAFTAEGDDTGVQRCMILGFAQAFRSVNYQRPRFEYNYFDCLAGVYIQSCLDNPKVSNNHGWPFVTIAYPAKPHPTAWAHRSGAAYQFKSIADWLTSFNNFSYGYYRGHILDEVNHYQLISPQHDNTIPPYPNSVGILVDGAAGGNEDGIIFNPRIAVHGTGVKIGTPTYIPTSVIGGAIWACADHGVDIDYGTVRITDLLVRDTPNGVTVRNGDVRLFMKGMRFDNVTTDINPTVPTTNIVVMDDTDQADAAAGSSIMGSNVTRPVVASASTLNLPTMGSTFNVSGTATIDVIAGGWAGRQVELVFTAAASVAHGTGATGAVNLLGDATFVAAAGDTLTLLHNGVQWYEGGRSGGVPLRPENDDTSAQASTAWVRRYGVPRTSNVYNIDGVDLDNVVLTGFHRLAGGVLNGPAGDTANYAQVLVSYISDTAYQIVFPFDSNTMWMRTGNGAAGPGFWNAWRRVAFDAAPVVTASAATLPVPGESSAVVVTGSTTITALTDGAYLGQRITLVFTASVTVTAGGNMRLAGSFNATQYDTLELLWIEGAWTEISRSVNA